MPGHFEVSKRDRVRGPQVREIMTNLCYSVAVLAVSLAFAAPALAIGEKATAEMKSADGKDLGLIRMIETTAGVLLKVKLKGLPPGPRGFHIHEKGECKGDFSSALGIYNPLGAKHGYLNDEGPMVGDLPNLIVGANGEVDVELISPFVTLSKQAEETIFDADGTAFVIFEKPDDYLTEPEGNTGGRIACGVIVPAK
jgi:Cu-Zn family superoxide dismutase